MGACRGCLVSWSWGCPRKTIEDLVWMSEVVAAAYDLDITLINNNELAIHQKGYPPDWIGIKDPKEVNRLRGLFTGIPPDKIDADFSWRPFEVTEIVKERINGLVETGRGKLGQLIEIGEEVSSQ